MTGTVPKPENMDGHSFEKWRFEVDCAIRDLGQDAYLDEGPSMVGMFNTNYDPATAARQWLRDILMLAPRAR